MGIGCCGDCKSKHTQVLEDDDELDVETDCTNSQSIYYGRPVMDEDRCSRFTYRGTFD